MYGAKLLMVRLLGSLLILSVGAMLTSCTRPTAGGPAQLSVKTPAAYGKVGALADLPANRKACYGVNITGSDLTGVNASACSPATGVVAGYVEAGQLIMTAVNRGTARKIDLYLYLLPVNDNSACPTMMDAIPKSQLLNTYLVGSATTDTLTEPTIVEITAEFPGLTNNLAVSSAMPASCTAIAPIAGSPPPFHASPAQQTVSNGTHTLRTRVNITSLPGDLSNSSYRLKLK